MTHWSEWQWSIYYIVQWIIAVCYILIPAALYIRRCLMREHGAHSVPNLPPSDALLFRLFVLACGIHHATHPSFMRHDLFWSMVAVDTATAAISSAAAARLALSVKRSI